VEVSPGVLQVKLPLPFALNHVNVWLLEDDDVWTVVDTGVDDAATRADWEELARVLGGRPIGRVVCTHYHPDHIGLAGWLCARFGAELCCSHIEWLQARMCTLESPDAAAATAARFYRRAGMADAALRPTAAVARIYSAIVAPLPTSFRAVRDGDELLVGGRRWTVLVGRGHSPGHVCLFDPAGGVLVSGDQVLPSITPNVSVDESQPDADPLADFVETVGRLEAVPDHVLVLPSHGRPFRGLHRRLHELRAHHHDRLRFVLEACAEPRTAHQLMQRMFARDLDPHQTTFAIGEGIAHANHLARTGLLRRLRSDGEPDRWEQARRP
jgi:glyoxylase-like metal-dependent hydrolase (beta-lactamase superfamily II)